MTTVSYQMVTVLPSVGLNFVDGVGLGAYGTAFTNIPGMSAVTTVSADGLTRTRTLTYDDSVQPTIDALGITYATALANETARRNAAGITNTYTQLA